MSRGRKPPSFGKKRPPSAGNSVRGGGAPAEREDLVTILQPDPVGFSFRAKYAGRCASCGRQFPVGERIRDNGEGEYVAIACCGEASERDDELGLEDGEFVVEDIKAVMPRVRRPACPSCFQIPAANGVCGC